MEPDSELALPNPPSGSLASRLPNPQHPLDSFSPDPSLLLEWNIPKPMHGLAPRVVLGKAWWDETRRAAYRSTGKRCAACWVGETDARGRPGLEGHEKYTIDYAAGRMVYVGTVPLCHYCHCFIHCGRLWALVDAGEESVQKYHDVMQHGESILRAAGLKRKNLGNVLMARWEDWRLVVFGAEYPPLHRDYAAWLKHFHPRDDDGALEDHGIG